MSTIPAQAGLHGCGGLRYFDSESSETPNGLSIV